MKDLNQVTLSGRLTKDSELRRTTSNIPVCSFSIAVNSIKKNADAWEDVASFFDCNLWSDRGEKLHPWLIKGTKISLTGELTQQRWEDKEGKKLPKIVITVNNIVMMTKKDDNKSEAILESVDNPALSDSDIPF